MLSEWVARRISHRRLGEARRVARELTRPALPPRPEGEAPPEEGAEADEAGVGDEELGAEGGRVRLPQLQEALPSAAQRRQQVEEQLLE